MLLLRKQEENTGKMAKKTENLAAISLENIKVNQDPNEKMTDFTNVPLEGEEKKVKRMVLKDPNDPKFENKKNKKPHRTMHFSDGILEEYSESEDEDETDKAPEIDPKTLAWLPWVWHHIGRFGGKSLSVADMCGEKLAWMFGITSPKYQHAIDEYNRMKKEEEEEANREARELEAERRRRLQLPGSNPVDLEGGNNNMNEDTVGLGGIYNKAFHMDNEMKLLGDNERNKSQGYEKSQVEGGVRTSQTYSSEESGESLAERKY